MGGSLPPELLSGPCCDSSQSTLTSLAARRGSTNERLIPMTTTAKSLALAAPFAGLIGGTTVRLNAPTAQSNGTSVQSTHAGVLLVQDETLPKHACEDQTDCMVPDRDDIKEATQTDCNGKGGCSTDR